MKYAFVFWLVLNAAVSTASATANLELIEKITAVHRLTPPQKRNLSEIFRGSGAIGQGNLSATTHPASSQECLDKLKLKNIEYRNPEFEKICGAPYMAPLYRHGASASQASTCIDQFEFPDIPCEFPVIWVTAREASRTCTAMGKRLCDAHEWEGSCAGSLEDPDYGFDLVQSNRTDANNIAVVRSAHNAHRFITWSYGPQYRTDVCGTDSRKSPLCDQANATGKGVVQACGSNTYPAGFFPECKSAFDVYDLHGNAAEHMNLPLTPAQMTSHGGTGFTEMKGSWFVFNRSHAHQDDCRWRAPFWHGTALMDKKSHANYHLGFRCCKSLGATGSAQQRNPVE
jgi:formylglycine-generating enzyme required for sulfatase activity